MLNIPEKMQPLVKEVKIVDKNVFLVVDSVKTFKKQVVETVAERPNKRRKPERRFLAMMIKFVRATQNLKGKHVKVAAIAATKQEGLYRDEKGHFVRI